MTSSQISKILEPSHSTVNSVARLFSEWTQVFTTKIKEEQYGMRTVELWAIALQQLEITEDEFKFALVLSIKEKWPPSTPADFLELVRSKKGSDYPDSYVAYKAAANDNYLHVVCYETAKRFGFYEIASQSEYIGFKIWQQIYKRVCYEHCQDSSKFEQNVGTVLVEEGFDAYVLAYKKNSLDNQQAIAQAAIEKIRKSL